MFPGLAHRHASPVMVMLVLTISGFRCNTSKVLRCKHLQGGMEEEEEEEAAVVSRPGKTQRHCTRCIWAMASRMLTSVSQ
jgi:hypothetical protein